MTESRDSYDPISEVEAMVRAAGQYVHASDDLRPRVLEAVRTQCGERRAQRCLGHVAVFVGLLAFFTTFGRDRLEANNVGLRDSVIAALSSHMAPPSEAANARGANNWDWSMIEAITELRRQQAKVFRLNL